MEPFITRPPTRDRQPFRTLTPSNRVPRGADSDLCVPPRRATPCTVWYRCGGNALQHWASRGREKSLSYAGLAIVHNTHKHHFLTCNGQASGSSPLFGPFYSFCLSQICGYTSRLLVNLRSGGRSEEHTSELQSRQYLVCRLLLEKKTV